MKLLGRLKKGIAISKEREALMGRYVETKRALEATLLAEIRKFEVYTGVSVVEISLTKTPTYHEEIGFTPNLQSKVELI